MRPIQGSTRDCCEGRAAVPGGRRGGVLAARPPAPRRRQSGRRGRRRDGTQRYCSGRRIRGMRLVLFALALLSAVAAAAQVTVGDEIVSGPLPKQIAPVSLAAPAVALARDHTGIAIAWTMANSSGVDAANRVYVTRIDESGGSGTTREMPLASANVRTHEVSPSLAAAPDGNGFIATWLEVDPSTPMMARAVFSRIDAALTPSAPTTLYPPGLPVAPTIVRTKNSKSWISAGGFLWSLDGTLDGPLGGIVASDMTIANDVPQLVGSHSEQDKNYYTCSPAPGCIVVG